MQDKANEITKALHLLKMAIVGGLTNYKIAKLTGITEATIGNYINGKTKPTVANARILIQYFEGNIRNKDEAKPLENPIFEYVPLIPISARAGYLCDYEDDNYIKELPTIPVLTDRQFKGKYRVFEVEGDSMYDDSSKSICDKDKILCREVNRDLWRYKLNINGWFFVIVHRTEGIVIKQIIEHEVEKGEIKCHSLNPLFNDFVLNLNDVLELYNIIKIVDRNARI